MRKDATIKLQGFYTGKVSHKVVTVQILTSTPTGGWEALDTATGNKVQIKGPEQLIKEVSAPEGTATGKIANKPKAKKTKPKTQTPKKDGRLSILDAAAKVLETESPLTCRQLVERMAEAGLWKSKAATPTNTLHAAISKEIRVKGSDARFTKAGRGEFALSVTQ